MEVRLRWNHYISFFFSQMSALESNLPQIRFILLSLLLVSCSKQSHWAFDQVHSDEKEFRSTKLSYYSGDPIYGIDLELLNTEEHLNIYLNIHSIPLYPKKTDQKHIPVKFEIEGKTFHYSAYRLSGGQRFLLSPEAAQTVIEALKNNREVCITLVEYRTVFKPEDFSNKFEKFLHPFSFQNPFHLPF